MIDQAEKPQIRIKDDGESAFDLVLPKRKNGEKWKGRRHVSWRLLVLIVVSILLSFALGYLVTPLSHLLASLTGTTTAHANKVIYSDYGSTRVVDLATGQDDVYTNAALLDPTRPLVSPDGARIAYWTKTNDRLSDLWISDVKTQTVIPIGTFYVVYPKLAWSADSKQIAFAAINQSAGDSASFESEELFVADATAGALRQVTHNGYSDEQPSWSPDGKKLVYASLEDGYHRLHILDLDTLQSHIVSTACFGFVPAWSPDGTLIAFHSNHEGGTTDQVYVINVDGSGLRRLTNNDFHKEGIAWVF